MYLTKEINDTRTRGLRDYGTHSTHFQTIAFSDALYFALPFKQINCTPDVFNGVGIFTSIFCPNNDGLKLDFKTTFSFKRGSNK